MANFNERAVCPDWVFHNNSNVHLSVDRDWFVSYVPFDSQVSTGLCGGSLGIDSDALRVHGVGTVEIPVKIRDRTHRTLRLDNVVHVPDYLCNIVGRPVVDGGNHVALGGTRGDRSAGRITASNGSILGVFQRRHNKFCLALSGPPVGPRTHRSAFETIRPLGVGARWSEAESTSIFRTLVYLIDIDSDPN